MASKEKELQHKLIELETHLAAIMAEEDELESRLEKEIDLEMIHQAKNNLKSFFVQAWDLVEPGKPYMDNWHIDCLCDHLEAVTRGEITNLIVEISPRCQPGYTNVLMHDGTYKKMEDIQVGDKVLSWDSDKKIWHRKLKKAPKKVLNKWDSGKKEVLQLLLQDGRTLDISKEHKVFTYNKGFIEAQYLESGDSLFLLKKFTSRKKDSQVSREDAFLLALWLAEGTKKVTTNLQFANISPKVIARAKECAENNGWILKTYNKYVHSIQSKNWTSLKENKEIEYWLDQYLYKGFPKRSENIYIPEQIFNAPLEVKREFVGALIATDGYIDKAGRVGISLTSETFIKELQLLLNQLGFTPTITKKIFKKETHHLDNWVLRISKKKEIKEFRDTIYVYDKQSTLNLLDLENDKTSNEIPCSLLNLKDFDCRLRYRLKNQKLISRKVLKDNLIVEKNAELEFLFNSEHQPLVIKEIKDLGEIPCFDIEVEDYNNYFSENLLVHNSSKSSICNTIWPVWDWVQDPTDQFITASTTERLAVRDSVRSRTLMQTRWFQNNFAIPLGIEFSSDSNTKTRYDNTKKGYRIATSPKGQGIGEGYSILVIDDPHKPGEIESPVARQLVLDWYTGTLSTRKNLGGRKVLIHQRLHEEDLIGWCKANEPDEWEVITIPMEYDPKRKFFTSIGWEDPRTVEGEIFWKERWPREELTSLKKTLQAKSGLYGPEAQLQQNPVPKEGGIIKESWFKLYDKPFSNIQLAKMDIVMGSWDLTFSDTGSSFNVGQVWAKRGTDKILVFQYREKLDIIGQMEYIKRMKKDFPMIRGILIEDKANGEAVTRMLSREIPGIILVNPKEIGSGDKAVRLAACAPEIEAGNVWFPSKNTFPWVKDTIKEITSFPRAANDDVPDTMSQMLNWFASKNLTTQMMNLVATMEDIIKAAPDYKDKLRIQRRGHFSEVTPLSIAQSRSIFE